MSLGQIELSKICSLSPPAQDQVHLWRVCISAGDEQSASIQSFLSHTEKEQADRFASVGARSRFITGRAMLRRLLGAYTSTLARDVPLALDAGGKPRFAAADGTLQLKFNLAHSGDWVLLGFTSGGEIGVDIEQHRPIEHCQAIAERHYSSREFDTLLQSKGESQRELFFRIWTRKEAVLKWHGSGLQTPLSSIEVPIEPHAQGWVDLPKQAQSCWVQSIDAPSGYCAALASARPIIKLIERELRLM